MAQTEPRSPQQPEGGAPAPEEGGPFPPPPPPPEPPARRRRWFRTLIFAGAVVATIVALWWGIPWVRHYFSHESTDDAYITGDITPVSFRVAGQVKSVYVTDNEFVRAGQVMGELDRAPLQASVDAAQANVNAAQSSLTAANARVQAAQSNIANAEAMVAAAKATFNAAQSQVSAAEAQAQHDQTELNRISTMYSRGVASQKELTDALGAARTSTANLSAAQSQLSDARARVVAAEAGQRAAVDQLNLARAQVAVANAQLEQAKSNLESAQLNLSYATLRSPFDGRVANRSLEPGMHVDPGQRVLSLVPPRVWVVANFKETQLTRMKVGQPADIYVDTYPGVRFEGHVDSFQPGTGAVFSLLPPENATGNFVKIVQRVPVKIVFNDTPELHDYFLAPGMSVVPEVNIKATPPQPPPRQPQASPSRSAPPPQENKP